MCDTYVTIKPIGNKTFFSLELLEAVKDNDETKSINLAMSGAWNLDAVNIAKIQGKTNIYQMILRNHPHKN